MSGQQFLTPQEIFDGTAHYLLHEQTERCMNDGLCVYRAPDGNRCAIGKWIKDEDYDPAFDDRGFGKDIDTSVDGLIAKDNEPFKKALINAGINVEDGNIVKLLTRLQSTHDSNVTSEGLRDELQDIADEYGLTFNA